MSKEEIQKALYKIACSVNVVCGGERTHVTISGLGENMEEAVKIMEELIADAKPDEGVLTLLKGNMLQACQCQTRTEGYLLASPRCLLFTDLKTPIQTSSQIKSSKSQE